MKFLKDMNSPFLSKSYNLVVKNAVYVAVIICLCIVILSQQKIIYENKENEMVTIVTSGMVGKYKIGNNFADISYLKGMATYLALLYTNISSSNVDSQLSEILMLADPLYYSKLKSKFQKRSNLLKKYSSISYSTQPSSNKDIEATNKKIKITMLRKKVVGDQISNPDAIDVSIEYSIVNGRFYLKDIEVISNE